MNYSLSLSLCFLFSLPAEFLTGLTKLFQQTRTTGSLFLTMKKYNGRTKPHPKGRKPKTGRKGATTSSSSSSSVAHSATGAGGGGGSPEPEDHLCLLRAGNGKKHISTVVSSREVNKFQMAYANVLKANVDGLKKRDRKAAAAGGGGGEGRKRVGTSGTGKKKRKPSTH